MRVCTFEICMTLLVRGQMLVLMLILLYLFAL